MEKDASGNVILHSKEKTADSLIRRRSVCFGAEQSGNWETWNQHEAGAMLTERFEVLVLI